MVYWVRGRGNPNGYIRLKGDVRKKLDLTINFSLHEQTMHLC